MAATSSSEPGLLDRLVPVPTDGNEVTLLQSGGEFFPSLVAAIDASRVEVRVETYIFGGDETGMRVAAALARAAGRGVDVRVVVDGFGTRVMPSGIADRLRSAGVRLLVYAPMSRLLSLDRERLRRLHRKLAAIDGQVAFVGGINVIDDLWDPNHGALDHPRLDYAVRLRGPIVASVRGAMDRLWRQVQGARLPRFAGRPAAASAAGADAVAPAGEHALPDDDRAAPDDAEVSPEAVPDLPRPIPGGLRAMLVLRDNLVHRRAIERSYLKAIGGSRREVLIATAYFFPGRRFRRALREAASRGVRVRLLLQGRAEYVLPHLAAQSMYGGLLRAGVEIVEYHRSFLHAKVAVIDDWSTVGSSNIDPFSLLLAREANVVVLDAAFAADLRGRLLASMTEGGRPVLLDEHARRSWRQRFFGWIAWRMLRLGVVVSGARHRY
jgi:cardiolipin synthase